MAATLKLSNAPRLRQCRHRSPAVHVLLPVRVVRPVVVRASVEVDKNAKTQQKSFMDELRTAAMKLHTRQQAPKEGGIEVPKPQAWVPSREGYLRFLVESKVVYDAFEQIVKKHAAFASLVGTGLERGDVLTEDIQWFESHYGLKAPAVSAEGPGMKYAKVLEELAVSSPPAFMCHYYNYYFAHTAGGRMIGSKVADMLLDGQLLKFYQWDGDVKQHLEATRAKMSAMADSWSPEGRQSCIDETADTFKFSGSIMRCITDPNC